MNLKLLNIDAFIEKNSLKQVKNPNPYIGGNKSKFSTDGLFSEIIFGPLGSIQRKKTFAYIDLTVKIIHPEAYNILCNINPLLTKTIKGLAKIKIDKNGIEEDENGNGGILFIEKNFDKIPWDKIKTNHPEYIEFVKKNRKLLFIDKIIVSPAGYRDVHFTESGMTLIQHSEINDLYTRLLNQISILDVSSDFFDESMISDVILKIQNNVNDINDWFKDRLKGKHGLIRGALLKKVVDYSARAVIIPSNELKLGEIALPWQICMKLYEPFFLHYILFKDEEKVALQLLKEKIGLKEDDPVPDIQSLRKAIQIVYDSPYDLSELEKNVFKQAVKNCCEGKQVIYKRDPVEDRDSFLSAHLVVDDLGFSAKINSLDLCKNTGDFDGDSIAIFALLTEEAQQEAKEKMNPIYSYGSWYNAGTIKKSPYTITQDAAITIYSATSDYVEDKDE